jgi:hypothetical protein
METIQANARRSIAAHAAQKTALLVAGVITLGAVACDRDTSSSSSNAPVLPVPGSPAATAGDTADAARITGAQVTADPLIDAENKDRIKQYPDEVKISPPKRAALITGFTVQVRESPRGNVVSTSETVQSVREIAHDPNSDYFLVVFDDPNAPGKQLAGWVYKDALENSAWWSDKDTAGAPAPAAVAASNVGAKGAKTSTGVTVRAATKMTCAHGQSHMRTTQDFCAKACKDDTGCDKNAGEICDGLGFQVQESSGKMTNANYCISRSAPNANDAHGPQHGSSAALNQANDDATR